MASLNHIRGLNKLFAGVNKANIKNGLKLNRIVRKATLILQRASMQQVPIDTGNLRASIFGRVKGRGFKTEGTVGYTASYAIHVHENPDALHGEAYNEEYAEQIAKAQSNRRDKTTGQFIKGASKGKWHSRGTNQKFKFLTDPASGMHRNPIFLAAVKTEALR